MLKEEDITTLLGTETNGIKGKQVIIGFFCALRNAELYDLRRGDIKENHDFECFTVSIQRSKTDQARCGFSTTISFAIGDISIVIILRDYLKALDYFILQHHLDPINQPLFTAISPQSSFWQSKMGVNSVAKMTSRIEGKLGLDNATAYTGHCFRGSTVTNRTENGTGNQKVKILRRWRSEGIAELYTHKMEKRKNAAT